MRHADSGLPNNDAAITTDAIHLPPHAWAMEVSAVIDSLATDGRAGLREEEARARLRIFGMNELEQRARSSSWQLFAKQFANTMTGVLGVAVIVTLLIGEHVDAAVIAAILMVNAVVGFAQERRAAEAMAALRDLTTTTCSVRRAGVTREIPSSELVPGDLVELKSGDAVPGDIRLLDVRGLRVSEATLTGEAEPSAKTTEPLSAHALVVDRHNMVFKGTGVTYGRASGVVVRTGMDTEVGQIARLLGAHSDTATPLQRRLAILGRYLAAAAIAIVVLVFVAGIARGEPAEEMFLTAVSLAVAAIPEGLPAVVTVSLALGARRMAEHHALIRKLPAVETLGSVTVVCTDKTGTLTENRMLVEHVWTPAGSYDVTGSGYEPSGTISGDGPVDDAYLRRVAMIAAACNDASLHAPADPNADWTVTGDPTEGALLTFAGKAGIESADLERRLPRRSESAFDPTLRRMTTVHADGAHSWIAVKGALSALVPLLHDDDRPFVADATAAAKRLATAGYRVLACADSHRDASPNDLQDSERGLRLAGLVGIADPPRAEARQAIASCSHAGVTTVMITGDDPRTATAVARRLDMDHHSTVLTGDVLDQMTDEELIESVVGIRVYAHDPEQKLRIVDAWKARGAIVAMTGDGVNDAPALQRADIGIAMGITGTNVSKEAADMVLADDNFATIVRAIEEGRRIYDNIRRFVRYLLTTNFGELVVMIGAPILGLPLPLLPLQILWINLVTDGLPAIALGLEPAEPNTMERPPRDPDESILAGGLWQHALLVGSLMAAVVIPLQAIARAASWPWQTMVFTTLALLQLGHALAVRSERASLFRLGLGSNRGLTAAVGVSALAQLAVVYVPALQKLFDTEALNAPQLAVVAVLSLTALCAVEVEKAVRRHADR